MRIQNFIATLKELSKHPLVGEIILIDNSNHPTKIEIDKVWHIQEAQNTFINPAWNKGAKLAKYDRLCFLNDDIWFDWKYLDLIYPYITEDRGMIGMSTNNYIDPPDEFRIIEVPQNGITTRGLRPIGYACCFFIHKKNWDEIPEDMKLWCGDDWIFYRSKHPNFIVDGMRCNGELSSTLSAGDLAEIFDPIKKADVDALKRYILAGQIENFLV